VRRAADRVNAGERRGRLSPLAVTNSRLKLESRYAFGEFCHLRADSREQRPNVYAVALFDPL
jgi:hypothetical protein